ncbi:MAG: amidohydrolase family protein [Gammaproteobacteria bacterium]|nr:amidohydrolase family protein [Gammaproteobacteria bacterium]
MSHDLVIRDGLVVDGSGGEPFAADLAVDGDTITAIGRVQERGREEIRADGLAGTPGFIDLHTHLDAQIGWDPMLTPVSWHGVTTALLGNCGVTFAPCKPQDRQFLAEMMETVEDIPREAIIDGLPWNWESYGEYLNALEGMNPAINVTGMVGHGAVRFYVMGERGIDENPTPEETARIAEVAGQSVRDGAIGFSTNRLPAHRLPDGRSIPGTFAEAEELEAIARQVGAHNGLMQNVPWYDKNAIGRDLEFLGRQARAGNGRVLFSVVETESFRFEDPHQIVEDLRAEGLEIYGVTVPRPGGFVSALKTNIFFPAWAKLRELDVDRRLDAIRDPAFRAELVAAAKADPASDAFAAGLRWVGDGDRPIYTKPAEDNLAALAAAAGEHPAEAWLRLVLESDGSAVFHRPFFNMNFDAVEALMARDWVVPGLGDAGAHVSQIMDSGWASFLLSHWVRDQRKLSLAEAVRRMTSSAARVLDLKDRGTLAPGMKADINVLDPERVEERRPEVVRDFPHGKSRLIQRAAGYKATVVNGHVILRDDEHTGERPGRVIRSSG